MSEEQGHSADPLPMEITLSTNWIVGDGSLDNAFSFETTAEDAPATAAAGGGLLLLRPPSLDSLPCEVTVSFREKHEIHQVYVKSTARTYEIYYVSDQPNDNEYLCTVRCGATSEEVRLRTGHDETYSVQGDHSLLGQMPGCDSTVNTEDGWVEVKIPGTVQEDGLKSSPILVDPKCTSTFQMNYEATAEISDASPCVSITIRFLSLQAKDSVHVEEIYIYADPAGSSCPDLSASMGGSVGKNSLLAMLVPSLMQLSKAGPGSRSENKTLDLKVPFAEEKAPATNSLDRKESEHQGTVQSSGDEDTIMAFNTKVASEDTKSTCSHHTSDPDNVLKSILEENSRVYTRFETLLDKLVTRVERIEAYCSSFEENMMRPLNRIEMRLLQLEQRLTTFSENFDCSKELPSLKISAPEFLSDESHIEDDISRDVHISRNSGSDASFADISSSPAEMICSMLGTQINPSLIVKEPAHEDDSSRNVHISINNTTFADLSSSPAEMTCSMLDAQSCPSLSIKAPEFPGEDEDTEQPSECLANASVSVKAPEFYHEDEENSDETSESTSSGSPRDKASSSLSSALASALEALLSSTAIESLGSSHGHLTEAFDVSGTALTSSTAGITPAVFEKNITSAIDVEVLDNSCMQNSNDRTSDDAEKATCSDSQSPIADTCEASMSKSETCEQDLCGTPEDKSVTILDDNILVHLAKEGNIEVIHDRHMSVGQAVAGNSDMEQNNLNNAGGDICGVATNDEVFSHIIHCTAGEDININKSVKQDAEEIGGEQAACGGSTLNLLSLRQIADVSLGTNFYDASAGHKVPIDSSDKSSCVLSHATFAHFNRLNGVARSSLSDGAIAGGVINPDMVIENTGNSLPGSKSEVGLCDPHACDTNREQRKNVNLDLDQSILDVKFTKERDSTTKDLLEALLGEVSFLEEQATANDADLGKSSNACSHEVEDAVLKDEDPFCDIALTVEESSSKESHLQVSGSSDHLLAFSSLI